mmetsp:Transcript_27548/g.38285  ORF Transcript_27548/g.38285 Transcript_27548/m.38285 type:complete len:233 (-) Transcript_27548:380-1078(-)
MNPYPFIVLNHLHFPVCFCGSLLTLLCRPLPRPRPPPPRPCKFFFSSFSVAFFNSGEVIVGGWLFNFNCLSTCCSFSLFDRASVELFFKVRKFLSFPQISWKSDGLGVTSKITRRPPEISNFISSNSSTSFCWSIPLSILSFPSTSLVPAAFNIFNADVNRSCILSSLNCSNFVKHSIVVKLMTGRAWMSKKPLEYFDSQIKHSFRVIGGDIVVSNSSLYGMTFLSRSPSKY